MYLSSRKMLMLWIWAVFAAGCGTNKGSTKSSNVVATRSVTYRGPIWVANPKQGQNLVQVKGAVWNNSGPSAEKSQPPEGAGDPQPNK